MSIEKHVKICQFNILFQGVEHLKALEIKLDRLEKARKKYIEFGLTKHIQDYDQAILKVKVGALTIASKIL